MFESNFGKLDLTRASKPNNLFPAGVRSTLHTEISHPTGLRPTCIPRARPIIWCPKQIPSSFTRGSSSALLVNSTSFKIHGWSSNELCSAQIVNPSMHVCRRCRRNLLEPVNRSASTLSKAGYVCSATTSQRESSSPE